MKKWILIILLLSTACSTETPVVDVPVPDSPPPARLVIDGQEQLSGIGSYCWSGSESQAICADMIGLPTPRLALRVVSPLTLELTLPLEEAPTQLFVTWIRAEEGMRLEFVDPDQIFWQPFWGEGHSVDLPVELAVENRIELQAEPGMYLLVVSPSWEVHGSVSYGFLVDVTAP